MPDLKLQFLIEFNQQYVPAGLRINKARLPLPPFVSKNPFMCSATSD